MPDRDEMPRHSKKGKRPLTEENTPETSANTMHVPLEFVQGTEFKAGDKVVLKVVAVDDDGLEVAYATETDEESDGESDANMELAAIDDGY